MSTINFGTVINLDEAATLIRTCPDNRFFLRGDDTLDRARGGFSSETFETEGACLAAARRGPRLFCFDTHQPGNGNGGHEYGTQLGQSERAALLAYLRTF
jgi:hypothetical protein